MIQVLYTRRLLMMAEPVRTDGHTYTGSVLNGKASVIEMLSLFSQSLSNLKKQSYHNRFFLTEYRWLLIVQSDTKNNLF